MIEDSPADARIIKELLVGKHASSVRIEHESTLDDGLARLEHGGIDTVLLDLNLKLSQGVETLKSVKQAAPSVPVIVLTGVGYDELVREAIASGAQDFLIKGEVDGNLLVRSISYAIERNKVEQDLRDREARLQMLTEQIPAILWTTDRDLKFTSSLGRALKELNLDQNEVRGMTLYDYFTTTGEESPAAIQMHKQALEGETVSNTIEWQDRWLDCHVEPMRDAADNIIGIIGVALDITSERRLERDIKAAQKIQQRLLPKKAPQLEGFDIAGACFPAELCSGDYYDFIPLPDGKHVLVIADVVGHGVGPAILAATVRSYLRAAAMQGKEPHEMLTMVNWLITNDSAADQYVTLFCCLIDPNRKSFAYASAGHQAYLLDSRGKAKQLDSGALPLGIEGGEMFNLSRLIGLKPDDILVLFTDGIPETRSPEGEFFGDSRVLDILNEHRDESARNLVHLLYDEVRKYAADSQLTDDVTAIIVKVLNPLDEETVNIRIQG